MRRLACSSGLLHIFLASIARCSACTLLDFEGVAWLDTACWGGGMAARMTGEARRGELTPIISPHCTEASRPD